jgi:hypothetical protein
MLCRLLRSISHHLTFSTQDVQYRQSEKLHPQQEIEGLLPLVSPSCRWCPTLTHRNYLQNMTMVGITLWKSNMAIAGKSPNKVEL